MKLKNLAFWWTCLAIANVALFIWGVQQSAIVETGKSSLNWGSMVSLLSLTVLFLGCMGSRKEESGLVVDKDCSYVISALSCLLTISSIMLITIAFSPTDHQAQVIISDGSEMRCTIGTGTKRPIETILACYTGDNASILKVNDWIALVGFQLRPNVGEQIWLAGLRDNELFHRQMRVEIADAVAAQGSFKAGTAIASIQRRLSEQTNRWIEITQYKETKGGNREIATNGPNNRE